jgi:starch-binding outer membrane protein, SusD/RagB family
MKSRYLILGALTLATTFTACQSSDDLLNVVSPTQVSDANFWSQENDAALFVVGTYNVLPSWSTIIELDGFTDNGAVTRQFDTRYPYTDGSFDPLGAYSRGLWNQYYNGVARTNILLANIDRIPTNKIDATRKARYIAEAKFLRGVMYLQLVSSFGDVAMPLVPLTDLEARELTNTPAAKIYDQIIQDFDQSAAVLPASYTGADLGRATKWAAIAFKARAALYAGRYQVAADAAKQVMDANVYSLHPSYSQLFTYAGENSKEIIFAHNYAKAAQASGQNNNIFGEFGPPTNSAAGHVVPIKQFVDAYEMKDGSSPATSPLFINNPYPNAAGTVYDNRDPRLAATVLFPGASWDGGIFDSRPKGLSTKPEAIDPQNENISVTGYNIRKYIDVADKADRGNGGIDVILMRYADILLMYAEAKFELGQGTDPTALAALNAVRTRAGMPALAALTQAEIRYERRMELAFEGLRLFDIRRWKTAAQVMPIPAVSGIEYIDAAGARKLVSQAASARAFSARSYLWPIPQAELDLNANLKQNPGF